MRGLLGWAALLLLAWLLSEDRSRIPWRVVAGGLVLEAALALLLIDVAPARAAVMLLDGAANALQRATDDGTAFLFGYLGGGALALRRRRSPAPAFILAFKMLPLVLVISAIGARAVPLGRAAADHWSACSAAGAAPGAGGGRAARALAARGAHLRRHDSRRRC